MPTGWVLQVLSIHEWFMSYTLPELQHDVWGHDPDAVVVDSVAPVAMAKNVADGVLINGRWKFLSGVEWCSWVALGGVAVLPDGPGVPEPCLFFVPRSEVTVVDEWDTVGLRGTASNTVVIEDDVFVPMHRVFTVARVAGSGRAMGGGLDHGPLFRVPWGPMLCASIFPASLGGAQRAVREFRTVTEHRHRPFEMGAEQRQNPAAQFTLADASARLDAMHALMHRYAGELERFAADDRPAITDEERGRLFAWRGLIARTSAEVANKVYLEAGANSAFSDSALGRAWRDATTAAQHTSLMYGDSMTSYGRTLMGAPGHPLF